MAGLVALAACTHGTPAAAPTPAPPGTALPGPATATVTTAASPSSSASTVGATASPTGGSTPTAAHTTPKTGTPTGTPGSVPSTAPVALVITQADTGKVLTLPFGSAAELRLGGNLRWSSPTATAGILSVAPETLTPDPGYQAWRITATGHGTTMIQSNGVPVCPPGKVCAQFIVAFRATIVVP